MNNEDRFTFFHSPTEKNGYLSNWYRCNFRIDGTDYTSMEQFMMYKKALLFGDNETAQKILCTNDVAKIKALGREVRNFNSSIWDKNKEIIVCAGLEGKFKQNDELRLKLKNTGETLIAECAVKDKIWGIGLSMTDPRRFNTDNWSGLNLLGKCLMIVRGNL